MADDNGRRRSGSSPSRPDPRGSWPAVFSALAVAGLLFAGAIALHYGKLPAFLMPATSLGEEATLEGRLAEGPASTAVTLVVSVPEEAKLSEPKAKAERAEQQVATVAVRVQNTSALPVPVPGADQTLRTDLARSYDSRTEDAVEVAAGKTRTVNLQFLIPADEEPDTLNLKLAGETVKLDVR